MQRLLDVSTLSGSPLHLRSFEELRPVDVATDGLVPVVSVVGVMQDSTTAVFLAM